MSVYLPVNCFKFCILLRPFVPFSILNIRFSLSPLSFPLISLSQGLSSAVLKSLFLVS